MARPDPIAGFFSRLRPDTPTSGGPLFAVDPPPPETEVINYRLTKIEDVGGVDMWAQLRPHMPDLMPSISFAYHLQGAANVTPEALTVPHGFAGIADEILYEIRIHGYRLVASPLGHGVIVPTPPGA